MDTHAHFLTHSDSQLLVKWQWEFLFSDVFKEKIIQTQLTLQTDVEKYDEASGANETKYVLQ